MALDKTAQHAALSIERALSNHNLSDQDKLDILKILESSLIKAADEITDSHKEATVFCCGHEADLAHKIEEEVNRKKALLISNLKALR